jgi:nitrate reductase NapAB chaperone NapD
MPVCSYLILPVEGRSRFVAERLSALPGCEVIPAENCDLLVLVTATSGPVEEDALQALITGTAGIQALLLTFGEIDPHAAPVRLETGPASTRRASPREERRLPVLPGAAGPMLESGRAPLLSDR